VARQPSLEYPIGLSVGQPSFGYTGTAEPELQGWIQPYYEI